MMRSLLLIAALFLTSACTSQQQATIPVPTLMVLPSETVPPSIPSLPTDTTTFEAEPERTLSAPPVAPTDVAGVITATGTVRLRTGAGSDFETVAEIESGVSVIVLDIDFTGQWLYIRLDNGQEGWVRSAEVNF
jgi:uncharacterized protein YgiM (DUF1202 family)